MKKCLERCFYVHNIEQLNSNWYLYYQFDKSMLSNFSQKIDIKNNHFHILARFSGYFL